MNRRPRQRQPFILRNRSWSLRGRHWKGGVSMMAVLPWKMLPYPLAFLVKLRLNCSLSVILGKIQSERQILYLLLNVSVSMAESESGCVSLREDWAKWLQWNTPDLWPLFKWSGSAEHVRIASAVRWDSFPEKSGFAVIFECAQTEEKTVFRHVWSQRSPPSLGAEVPTMTMLYVQSYSIHSCPHSLHFFGSNAPMRLHCAGVENQGCWRSRSWKVGNGWIVRDDSGGNHNNLRWDDGRSWNLHDTSFGKWRLSWNSWCDLGVRIFWPGKCSFWNISIHMKKSCHNVELIEISVQVTPRRSLACRQVQQRSQTTSKKTQGPRDATWTCHCPSCKHQLKCQIIRKR